MAPGPEAMPEAAASAVSLPPLPMVLDAFRAALQSVGVRNLGTLKLDVEKVRRDTKPSEAGKMWKCDLLTRLE